MAHANAAQKPLFILVEKGVSFKAGIHGDIEHIEFPKDHISSTFLPLLEGFKATGLKIAHV